MRVQLLYFDSCPHWRVAEERLAEALRAVGIAEHFGTMNRGYAEDC